ncbi:hypothetical protein KTQ42_08295|uniref:hypothetical protein n=1 Tax=Noviherbaspirillum sp. L7-7A TaxID=2850560 RepID=UPI001C2C93A4|nr:hypothetical protein [Noviherbaspirillum sp. L7-7A]MBV0879301.1 hypothetical protein [Noviherbaspirillum sp. L7-7A]
MSQLTYHLMNTSFSKDITPIAFKSAEQFQTRPNYQAALRCNTEELDRIVGKYELSEKEKLQCGLNGCNNWHWHGFVIRTKDGQETNCGKDCGSRDFKVSFKEIIAVYRRAEDAASKKDRLTQILADRESLLAEAERVTADVRIASSKIERIRAEIKKDAVLDRAFQSCMKVDGRIQVEDDASKRLREELGLPAGKADLRTIAVIRGGNALRQSSIIHYRLSRFLVEPLAGMTAQNLDALTTKQLAAESMRFGNLKQHLSDGRQFLTDAAEFNSAANIETLLLLQELIPKNARTSRLSRIFERLPQM